MISKEDEAALLAGRGTPHMLMDWIETYAANIFINVREPDGCKVVRALGEMSGEDAIKHAFRFLRSGVVPIRVRDDDDEA